MPQIYGTTSLSQQSQEMSHNAQEAGGEGYGLNRIILPLSSLGGWALIAVSILTALHVFGINIQPLLAVGGVSGIAIGFGAQTVTANAIAGINLVSVSSMAT